MEISIRNVSDTSGISGRPFSPGDLVWSCLYRDEDGVLDRLDVHTEELEDWERGKSILCKWSQVIKKREATEAENKRAALQSTEEVFLSLYEEAEEEDKSLTEARDRLKYFLAIQLERKRVLKPASAGKYRHVSSKREYNVPRLELTPELAVQFQKEMATLEAGF